MWDDVFARLRPGLTASEADLDAAEAALGFPLPRSYRSFAQVCGAGLIGGEVRVHTPAPEPAADLVARAHVVAHSLALALENLADRGAPPHRFVVEGGPEDPGEGGPTERACFFGQTGAGGFLFWDVRPDAGADGPEYAIWLLDPDLETVRFGGPDLDAFCRRLFGEAATLLGPGAAPLPATFEGEDAGALARLGRAPDGQGDEQEDGQAEEPGHERGDAPA